VKGGSAAAIGRIVEPAKGFACPVLDADEAEVLGEAVKSCDGAVVFEATLLE
jgi:hypothetical protein